MNEEEIRRANTPRVEVPSKYHWRNEQHQRYLDWCHEHGFWGIQIAWVYPAHKAIQVHYFWTSQEEYDAKDLHGVAPYPDYKVTTVYVENWPDWAAPLAGIKAA